MQSFVQYKHCKWHTFKGDFIWIHLLKERFPNKPNAKLSPETYGHFRIVQKIHDNAYKVKFYAYLSPYIEDEEHIDSRTNLFQPENDMELSRTI